MKPPNIRVQFYETYFFASAIRNILHDQFSYIRTLDEFYGDGKHLYFSKPFPRFSAFHSFLEFVIDDLLTAPTEEIDLDERRANAERFRNIPTALAEIEPFTLPIESAFKHHDLEYETFLEWLQANGKRFADADPDDIHEYLSDLRLCGPFEELLIQSVRESFFVLYGNRHLLMLFNDMMARQFQRAAMDEVPEEHIHHFEKAGVLKRVHVPEWVRRAVFYRDKGRCVSCQSDLSGLVTIWSEEHFDHIVPLAGGGLNDVTNIQLLCGACNLKKGAGCAFTSSYYEDWYPLSA
jgi:hypothetical protein